jgi:hypothetical protein
MSDRQAFLESAVMVLELTILTGLLVIVAVLFSEVRLRMRRRAARSRPAVRVRENGVDSVDLDM